jgi:PGF-CTERM protein
VEGVMNTTTVKIGIGIILLLAISAACAENAQYTAVVYAPANLSVSVDAPSMVSLDDTFVVTANVSNNGTENASKVVAKLIFIDEDNDIKRNRRAIIYSSPVRRIGNLDGGDSRIVSWVVRTKAQEKYIGNYSIVVTADGTAEISGRQLEDEQRSPIVIPGFEIIFAITGLLAVSYLLRRRKTKRYRTGRKAEE